MSQRVSHFNKPTCLKIWDYCRCTSTSAFVTATLNVSVALRAGCLCFTENDAPITNYTGLRLYSRAIVTKPKRNPNKTILRLNESTLQRYLVATYKILKITQRIKLFKNLLRLATPTQCIGSGHLFEIGHPPLR